MRKVIRHNFLRKYPIVLVNRMSDWANGMIESNSYYEKIGIKGRPLSYVLFEIDGARRVHGRCNEAVVAATMAMIGGSEKYPMNPKLAAKWAMEKCIENNHREAYSIIFEAYEDSYGECTVGLDEMDWAHPHQQDKLDDQFDDKDDDNSDIDGIIKMMDDEADSDKRVEEATIRRPATKKKVAKKTTAKKSTARKPAASISKKKTTKKAAPRKSATIGATSGRKSRSKFPGFVHVSGGDGKLYVQGNMTKQAAQKYASKNGATHKEKGGKIVPIPPKEKAALMKGQDSSPQKRSGAQEQPTRKKKTPTKQKSGNVTQVKVADVKQSEQGENEKTQQTPTVVKVAKKGSKEHQKALDSVPISKTDRSSLDIQSTLSAPTPPNRKRDVDQEAADGVHESPEFTRKPTISDSEFSKKNKDFWVGKKYISLNSVRSSGMLAEHTVTTLERAINTKYNSTTKKFKTHFSPEAGEGDSRSQVGELATAAFTALDDKGAERLRDELLAFIDGTGNKSMLDRDWLDSAFHSSRTIRRHFDARYGDGNWQMQSIGWDTRKEFEAMTGLDYFESKGRSSDMYCVVSSNGNYEIADVTLKKDLNIKFLNSGPTKILARLKNPEKYDGTDLDVSVFIANERKWLKKSATESRIAASATWLKSMEKKLKTMPDGDMKKSIIEALEVMRKIGGKNIDAKKISKALNNTKAGTDAEKEIRKAAWLGIYAMGSYGDKKDKFVKDASGVISQASKLYSDYASNFMDHVESDPELRDALLETVRDEIPLNDIAENIEFMAMREFGIDRAVMEKMFGTSDPQKIKDGLVVIRPKNGGEPFVGYAAGTNENPIPIGRLRFRAESLGYGNRIKFDIDMESMFSKAIESANKEVYGVERIPKLKKKK